MACMSVHESADVEWKSKIDASVSAATTRRICARTMTMRRHDQSHMIERCLRKVANQTFFDLSDDLTLYLGLLTKLTRRRLLNIFKFILLTLIQCS